MRTYVFVDASNLFYGFDNEYGWRIDYNRFRKYFEDKYGATHVFYFGGIDIKLGILPNKEFFHNYSTHDTVDLNGYIKHFENGSCNQSPVTRTNCHRKQVYSPSKVL